MKTRVWVMGCGHPWRGDDAVGLWVAAQVEERRRPGVTAFACQDPWAILATLDGTEGLPERIVCVDALRGGHPPGTVYRLPAAVLLGEPGRRVMGRYLSLHESPLPGLLRVASIFYPQISFSVIGIEPAVWEFGVGLSPAVAQALPRAVAAVEAESALCLPERG